MSSLLSVDEAKRKIIEKFSALEAETIPLNIAAGRVLAENVISGIDLPLFPNSSMDGFAVRSIDVVGATNDKPKTLKVAGLSLVPVL